MPNDPPTVSPTDQDPSDDDLRKLGPAPRPEDVPTLRPIRVQPGEFIDLTPTPGYQGCLVLVQTQADTDTWAVVAYVSKHAHEHSIVWTPPVKAPYLLMDVPRGFDISNGAAIRQWIVRSNQPGKPPGPGPVTD